MRSLIVSLLFLGSLLIAAVRSQESGHEGSGLNLAARPAQVSPAVSQSESDQQHSHFHRPDGLRSLPIAVDGAKTPERIPDAMAYAHFLAAIAEPLNASPERARRRASMIARIGLTAADSSAIVGALAGVREQVNVIHEARSSTNPPTSNELASQTQEERILIEARERVYRALSSDGVKRLDRFVREHVKTRIVIYGSAPSLEED
jgi:hypothetical protein